MVTLFIHVYKGWKICHFVLHFLISSAFNFFFILVLCGLPSLSLSILFPSLHFPPLQCDTFLSLEKEHDYREEHFDFIQSHIRHFCLQCILLPHRLI